MSRKTAPPLSYPDALQEFYGGIHGLNKQPLPFTCKCGEKSYPGVDEVKGLPVNFPVMTMDDCYKHIRKVHRERVRNRSKREIEKEQAEKAQERKRYFID